MKVIIRLIASDRVVHNMKKLYPPWKLEEKLYEFYKEKLKLCIIVLAVGFLMAAVLPAASNAKNIYEGKILRNGYGQGNKKLTLTAEINNGSEPIKKDVEITVSEKRYSDSQIDKMSYEFREKLMTVILNDNKSADYVTKNLSLVKRLDDYPFSVDYAIDKPLLISREGQLNEDKITDGSEVKITATITYFEYREEYSFYVCLYKPQPTKEERYLAAINDAVAVSDKETINSDYFVLPNKALDGRIKFSEKKNNSGIIVCVLTVITAILIFFLKDKETDKEAKLREDILMLEYPRLINKFTLFYNSGMPIKKIWFKVCSDYESETGVSNCLYEEMLITRSRIMDGKNEIEAYEEFARRINLRSYQVFINLIIQAVLMGKKEFGKSLELECKDAFNERKNKAKRLFEEAGTKLLVPMFMMLFVVVIIIMFPAFKSFKM